MNRNSRLARWVQVDVRGLYLMEGCHARSTENPVVGMGDIVFDAMNGREMHCSMRADIPAGKLGRTNASLPTGKPSIVIGRGRNVDMLFTLAGTVSIIVRRSRYEYGYPKIIDQVEEACGSSE
ncbi:hypothetical protein [Dyella sp. ASV21]|uniref:hypothetical protein n=1 Tax=Dyella sp. ASV21 TaxID=2795114 RepID=UPI0018EA9A32|nr:hypothetical protein [Dyella sp. ASV21]